MSPRLKRLVRGSAVSLALVGIACGVLVSCNEHIDEENQTSTGPAESSIGGPFQLTDTAGKPLTDRRLKGKPYAVFFGFTRCPDVCPTSMNRMAQLHRALGADADKLNMVFVSVDPEHDKAEDIASFLSMFPAPVIGATGTADQIKALTETLKLHVAKVPLENGDYTIDHTAAVYLMDREGRFFEPMSATESLDTNLSQLRQLLAV